MRYKTIYALNGFQSVKGKAKKICHKLKHFMLDCTINILKANVFIKFTIILDIF